eukprot:3939462-Rhodomonas_salina.1
MGWRPVTCVIEGISIQVKGINSVIGGEADTLHGDGDGADSHWTRLASVSEPRGLVQAHAQQKQVPVSTSSS